MEKRLSSFMFLYGEAKWLRLSQFFKERKTSFYMVKCKSTVTCPVFNCSRRKESGKHELFSMTKHDEKKGTLILWFYHPLPESLAVT